MSTASVATKKGQGTVLSTELASLSQNALQQSGSFINVAVSPQPITTLPGPALGSIDQSLALVASASGGTNTVKLYNPGSSSPSGTLTLNYADPLLALSSTFRPDLTSRP